MANRVLIIDDDEKLLKLLSIALEKEEFIVSTASKGEDGLNRFKEIDFDVALIDLMLPDMDGIELLKVIRNIDSDFPVIMITGHASIDLAVKAMRMGAFYFIEKPASTKAILEILKRAIEQKELMISYQSLKKTAEEKFSFSGIIGKSKEMQEIFELIERIASAEATVLIQGESGTGKELVAKAIHFNSPRKENRSRAFLAGNRRLFSKMGAHIGNPEMMGLSAEPHNGCFPGIYPLHSAVTRAKTTILIIFF